MNENCAIDFATAVSLLKQGDLLEIGQMADAVRRKKHPDNRVSFVVDRNVNYTNVCESKCRFCAFYRDIDADDAYVLDEKTIYDKIEELGAHDGTQLLMQGGLHPGLKIDWFENLFRQIRSRFPTVQIHSLSPAEIIHIAGVSGLEMEECLARLHAAGLSSLPGGGAEVLVGDVGNESAVRGYSEINHITAGNQSSGKFFNIAAGLG